MAGEATFRQTIKPTFVNGFTTEGATTYAGNQTVTGSITASTTITAGTGITITTGGLTVTAGGITITAGGLNITAGALNHDGTTVGLYGATPTAQAALPAALRAAFTQAGTDNGDTAIAAAVAEGGAGNFGFASADDFEAVVALVASLRVTVDAMRTALINVGITAAA